MQAHLAYDAIKNAKMNTVSAKTSMRLIELLAAFTLLIYPSLMIAIKGGMNGAFALLLLLSVIYLIFRPSNQPSVVWDREAITFLMAMTALPIAIFLSQSYHGHYSAHPYDAASRFLLAVPIFILLRTTKFNVAAAIQYGFPLGACVALIMGVNDESSGRMRTPFLDPIHFGDFALIIGIMSLLSINWPDSDKPALRILKILGFLAGMYATLLSGTLGAWIAIPIFLVILIYFNVLRFSWKQSVMILLVVLMSGFLSYQFNDKIKALIDVPLKREKTLIYQGNLNTDIGVRLQLYKAAVFIIAQNPLFGVGPEGFKDQMEMMERSGVITKIAASAGLGEVHNEILSRTAGSGICGFIAILMVYFIPLRIFINKTQSASTSVRRAGIMGVTFICGFFVFGLSLDVLNLTMAAAFYSLTVAVLLAACLNVHHDTHKIPDPVSGI